MSESIVRDRMRRILLLRTAVLSAIILAVCLGIGWQSGFKSKTRIVESAKTCATATPITVSATTTQIVPALGGAKIRICSAVISRTDTTAVVATAKFVEGAGPNCVTRQTNTTAVIATFGSGEVGTGVYGESRGDAVTTHVAGNALCVAATGATSSMDVTISYVYEPLLGGVS
jgi:hypothetical protein